MKELLTKLCWPILKYFEGGQEPYEYKSLNRKILIAIGSLFCALGCGLLFVATATTGYGFLIPVSVFMIVGVVCFVVGVLGSDRAVSKIWGNR
ncbi:MAG: hypothetical protein ACRBCS_11685 [Cellvibrionaceae bacterium]